jgi:hypothetical protein
MTATHPRGSYTKIEPLQCLSAFFQALARARAAHGRLRLISYMPSSGVEHACSPYSVLTMGFRSEVIGSDVPTVCAILHFLVRIPELYPLGERSVFENRYR